jgi:hypothetical protein
MKIETEKAISSLKNAYGIGADRADTDVTINHNCEGIHHRSFLTQLYECINHRHKSGAVSLNPDDYGHLQYLRMAGCKRDARSLRKALRGVMKAKRHYVVASPGEMDMQGEMDTLFENGQPLSHCPNYTISTVLHRVTETKKMYVVPMLIHVHTDYGQNCINLTSFTKPLNRWVCSRDMLTIESVKGRPGDCYRVCLMEERNAIAGEFIDAAQERLNLFSMQSFLELKYLLELPPEWKQAEYYDSNGYVAPEPSQKKQKSERTFVRLYKPAVKTIPPVDHVPEPTGVKQLEHERIGHWRHYKNGRRIWIKSYKAGNPELGSTINKAKTIEVVG